MWKAFFQGSFVFYLVMLLRAVYQVSYPPSCTVQPADDPEAFDAECFVPYITAPRINLHLYATTTLSERSGQHQLLLPADALLVWSKLNFSRFDSFDTDFKVPIPVGVRLRQDSLCGYLLMTEAQEGSRKELLSRFALTVLRPRRVVQQERHLLETTPGKRRTQTESQSLEERVQHWKYGSHPLVLRVAFIDTPLRSPHLQHLQHMLATRRPHPYTSGARAYEPVVWVDDASLTRQHYAEMSRNLSMPSPTLRLRYTAASLMHFGFKKLMREALGMLQSVMAESELDEIRWWLSDERLLRYFLTQLLSILHIVFQYLAFMDDWRFFVGRKSNKGVSLSSLLFSAVRSTIVFLYLLDAGTSWLILLSLAKDVTFALWKTKSVLRLDLQYSKYGLPQLSSARDAAAPTAEEQSTSEYDTTAFLHVVLCLAPLVLGVALHSLCTHRYRSWWSWLISSLADSMYLFGFASMTPQLYINYKLKSVAHLPVRAFMFKIFITFVDDAFAFLVKMPLKHKLMTLRDDLVFVGFLYQWWIYPADKERPNEFGFQYEGESGEGKELKDGNGNTIKEDQEQVTSSGDVGLVVASQFVAASDENNE